MNYHIKIILWIYCVNTQVNFTYFFKMFNKTTRNLNLHVAIIIFLLDSTALAYHFCLVLSLISRQSLRTVKGLEALSHLHSNKLA